MSPSATLQRQGWAGRCSVEPFTYTPDGPTAAARAIGYLRGLLEAAKEGEGPSP